MKRRHVVIGLVVLAAVAVSAYVAWPRSPRPWHPTFESVREGMTFEEVCATLGRPPGNYATRPVDFAEKDDCGLDWTETWITDDTGLVVYLDEVGRVYRVGIVPMRPVPEPPSFFSRLRTHLGL